MKMTITVTDDASSTQEVTAPSQAAEPGRAAPAADAGPAPAGGTTSGVGGNGYSGADGADGGAAPEWLREILEANPVRGRSTTSSGPALPAVDAGAARAIE